MRSRAEGRTPDSRLNVWPVSPWPRIKRPKVRRREGGEGGGCPGNYNLPLSARRKLQKDRNNQIKPRLKRGQRCRPGLGPHSSTKAVLMVAPGQVEVRLGKETAGRPDLEILMSVSAEDGASGGLPW